MLASRAFSMLANGMGGIDWSGLPYVVEILGVSDVEMLVHRLMVMKTHRPDVPGGKG